MLCPIDAIEVLEKMKTLDQIYDKESGRKWHLLFTWLNDKAIDHHVQLDARAIRLKKDDLPSRNLDP